METELKIFVCSKGTKVKSTRKSRMFACFSELKPGTIITKTRVNKYTIITIILRNIGLYGHGLGAMSSFIFFRQAFSKAFDLICRAFS